MSKDRIQIDGVWYVREENQIKYLYLSKSYNYSYEDERIRLQAIFDFDNKFFVGIEFADKETKDTEFWDGETWFKNIAKKDSFNRKDKIDLDLHHYSEEISDIIIQFIKQVYNGEYKS